MNGCLALMLDSMKRRAKRILASQNYSAVKFYPHSLLTITVQMATGYEIEIEKFARVWCNSDSNLIHEINAIKEIFEAENKDDMTWIVELLANKYFAENVDRLIYLVHAVRAKR